ncbi:MAG: DedA family protein [Burkholderiales bacterium]
MNLTELIQSYGYIAVFVGTFLEGETILLLAGFAAHRGYLSLPGVMAIACLASFMGDQLYFFLGRRYGNRLTGRFPGLNKRVERFRKLLDLYHVPVILSLRFLYGLRIAGPIALGMTDVSWLRYLILNLLGAVVWAILIAGLGYVFGNAMTLLLGELRQYEGRAFLTLSIGGIMVWLVYIIREWRKRENQT